MRHEDATWWYDSLEEFIPEYRKYGGYARASIFETRKSIVLNAYARYITVSVEAPNRVQIEGVFEVFEKHAGTSKLPPLPKPKPVKPPAPGVFIGHGRSKLWIELKDHLQDKHHIQIEAYETGARAGHTIRDILEDMVDKSTFALLVLTAEDEQLDGTFRARQNVIHETGLFQGRLGFSRAIVLLEEGTESSEIDEFNTSDFQREIFAKHLVKLLQRFDVNLVKGEIVSQ